MMQTIFSMGEGLHTHLPAAALPREAPAPARPAAEVGARVVITAGAHASQRGTVQEKRRGGWWTIRLSHDDTLVSQRTGSFAPLMPTHRQQHKQQQQQQQQRRPEPQRAETAGSGLGGLCARLEGMDIAERSSSGSRRGDSGRGSSGVTKARGGAAASDCENVSAQTGARQSRTSRLSGRGLGAAVSSSSSSNSNSSRSSDSSRSRSRSSSSSRSGSGSAGGGSGVAAAVAQFSLQRAVFSPLKPQQQKQTQQLRQLQRKSGGASTKAKKKSLQQQQQQQEQQQEQLRDVPGLTGLPGRQSGGSAGTPTKQSPRRRQSRLRHAVSPQQARALITAAAELGTAAAAGGSPAARGSPVARGGVRGSSCMGTASCSTADRRRLERGVRARLPCALTVSIARSSGAATGAATGHGDEEAVTPKLLMAPHTRVFPLVPGASAMYARGSGALVAPSRAALSSSPPSVVRRASVASDQLGRVAELLGALNLRRAAGGVAAGVRYHHPLLRARLRRSTGERRVELQAFAALAVRTVPASQSRVERVGGRASVAVVAVVQRLKQQGSSSSSSSSSRGDRYAWAGSGREV